jgi:MFS family permease
MTQLILFRVVQGMGAGAVQPVATTIIGDIFSLEERARLQGWLSSMWALASLVGPLLGGFIVEHLHWAWIFWVNLPIGPLAIAGVYLFLEEPKTRRRHSVDYAGAALLASGVSLLLFGLLQGGVAWAWTSGQSVAMLGGALVLLVGFVLRQQRAPEPILPLDLFKNRAVALADCGFLLIGGVVLSVTTFIPLFVQGVLGGTPTQAGFTLVPMSIGWPLASTFVGRFIMALGFRRTALLGAVLAVIGSVLLVWSAAEPRTATTVVWIGLAILVQGAGFGFMTTTLIVGLQSSVPWSSRGVATASAMFSRQLGSTIWVAMLGSVLNAVLMSRISTAGGDGPGLTSVLLDRTARASLDPAALLGLESALAGGIQAVFVGVLATVVLLLVVAWLLPSAPTEAAESA